MPLARIAVISLSAASRLNPSRMPTRIAIGIVTVNAFGSVYRMIRNTSESPAEFRTASSRILLRSRINSTNVNSTPPSRAWEETSRRI